MIATMAQTVLVHSQTSKLDMGWQDRGCHKQNQGIRKLEFESRCCIRLLFVNACKEAIVVYCRTVAKPVVSVCASNYIHPP